MIDKTNVNNKPHRGVVWLPEHLTGETMGTCKILCNATSSRIIHEGWDNIDLAEWPDELLEFLGIIVFAGG